MEYKVFIRSQVHKIHFNFNYFSILFYFITIKYVLHNIPTYIKKCMSSFIVVILVHMNNILVQLYGLSSLDI